LNVNFEVMKKQIEKIVKQLCKHNINKEEAVNKLLNLHSVSGCYWEKPKKIELKLEDMASGEMKGDIKGLNYKVCNMASSKEI
jgi:hypothetical protein